MTPHRPIVLSVEQALSMPYATLRFVHQGWRVIKVEATPVEGRRTMGDPNRAIGKPVGKGSMHSYFVAPNVGKEAIALNLKTEEGRNLLRRLIRALPVDVFCTNTMPARHEALGIDADSLQALRPELIWASISAWGTAHGEVPGYDPVMQAECGYMDLTGDPKGPPLQCGPPIIDLKAGDEVFAQVALALWKRELGAAGARIDVSMGHAAVSWLQTFLPMLDMGSTPEELRRSGNEHRQFIPVNAYPTADGWLFLAIGSDAQWRRFVGIEAFAGLDREDWRTNEGRRATKDELHRAIGGVTKGIESRTLAGMLAEAAIPNAPIRRIEEVASHPFVAGDLCRTVAPSGDMLRLPPPAVPTRTLEKTGGLLPFAPGYGADTEAVLVEIGCRREEIREWADRGILALGEEG